MNGSVYLSLHKVCVRVRACVREMGEGETDRHEIECEITWNNTQPRRKRDASPNIYECRRDALSRVN